MPLTTEIEISVDQLRSKTKCAEIENALQPAQPSNGRRVALSTLGCKVNVFESETIAQSLTARDWRQVGADQVADLYVINTCTVTREADRQARQKIRRLIKTNPNALVVVTGCYAQMNPQACAKIPGVDLVLGNDRKLELHKELHKVLPSLEKPDSAHILVGDLDKNVSLPREILTGYQDYTRAFVQIQQGCNQGCTFCVIHTARGPSRSLSVELILRQVESLVLNGFFEIVICGVDLGAYGEDLTEGIDLVYLLKQILAIDANINGFRLRLSSLDPVHISDELIDLITSEPRICKHLHLSMQSGNTLILKRMKRRYDADYMRARVLKLRQKTPNLVISADIIVGFPTETIEQFEDTVVMLDELEIAYPHVFSYSNREGTPAARIPAHKQVDSAEKKRRNALLRARAKQIEGKLLKSRIGTTMMVLPEKRRQAEHTQCRSEEYIPVLLKTEHLKANCWQKVTIVDAKETYLIGQTSY